MTHLSAASSNLPNPKWYCFNLKQHLIPQASIESGSRGSASSSASVLSSRSSDESARIIPSPGYFLVAVN